ncbi:MULTISPECIES: hypothetical protein [Oceanotoga]|nr:MULTISPECIES: hypothetical protein [Oceanotoga]MDN5341518.1 hypothetical protein [Oceanotoga sp.]
MNLQTEGVQNISANSEELNVLTEELKEQVENKASSKVSSS